jgi:hypothetical protein
MTDTASWPDPERPGEPCLTPSEVAAREAAAAQEMRARCADVAVGKEYCGRYRTWPWWQNKDGSQGNRSGESDVVKHADAIAKAIAALPLPATDALARALAEAEKRGMERAAQIADGFTCGGCGMDGKAAAAIRAAAQGEKA